MQKHIYLHSRCYQESGVAYLDIIDCPSLGSSCRSLLLTALVPLNIVRSCADHAAMQEISNDNNEFLPLLPDRRSHSNSFNSMIGDLAWHMLLDLLRAEDGHEYNDETPESPCSSESIQCKQPNNVVCQHNGAHRLAALLLHHRDKLP